jgi:hypothetical protein
MEQLSKLVREEIHFERNTSGRSIKDKLLGFRPGQLITFARDRDKNRKPYLEVYMYIGPDDNSITSTPRMITYQIGNLVRSIGQKEITHFSLSNLKVLQEVSLFEEGKRGLEDFEIELVKKKIAQYPDFMSKIKKDTGISPTLNEAFKRGRTEQEIKRSLFDWRRGQILAVHGAMITLYVFAEKKDQLIPGGVDDWTIHCLEIGSVSGNPPYAFIHLGPFQGLVVKRESSLEEPTQMEKLVIYNAISSPKSKKYIDRVIQLVGVKPFV